MSSATHSQTCPVCSAMLEGNVVCLACLLNEGLEAGQVERLQQDKEGSTRTLALPCDFAGYRLLSEIASGGMGIVYEAQDLKLKRVVALKVIRNAVFATREEAARFKAETQAVAQLDHPGIVPIYESGEEDGMPFYTMRLAEGGSLAARLKQRGALPEGEAALLMSRIARAVQHAHDHGVLHRDLKPANILLDGEGSPMLSDFGLAKLLDNELELTRTQAHVGTPHYMSPEQAAGNAKQITTASDVWALGVMLYQMLTGKMPFEGGSAVEVMRRITEEEPQVSSSGRLVSRTRVSAAAPGSAALTPAPGGRLQPDLATLILRCLEKQPARRLPGAGFLADELDRFLDGKPIQSRAVDSVERLWKLSLRHKAAALAILGTTVSLVAGTVVSVWQALKATEAQQLALKEKDEAETVSSIILNAVNNMDELTTGSRVDLKEVRKKMLERIHEFEGSPVRKASLLNGVALVVSDAQTVEAFEQTLVEARKTTDLDDPQIWMLRYNLAAMRSQDKKRRAEIIAELREVLDWMRRHQDLARHYCIFTLTSLGECLMEEGEAGAREAVALLEEACQLIQDYPDAVDASFPLRCRFHLAAALFRAGRREEALAMGRRNCALAVEAVGRAHLRTGLTFARHAANCRESGLVEEAIVHGQTALECFWDSAGPLNSFAKDALRQHAQTLLKKGDRAAHLKLMHDALRVCDQQLGPAHSLTLFRVETCLQTLVNLNRYQEASALGQEWLHRVRLVDGSLPSGAVALLRNHAYTLRLQRKHAAAETLLRELLALTQDEEPPLLLRFADLSDLAETLLDQFRPAEALPVLQEVIQALEKPEAAKTKLAQTELPLARQRLERAELALKAPNTAGR